MGATTGGDGRRQSGESAAVKAPRRRRRRTARTGDRRLATFRDPRSSHAARGPASPPSYIVTVPTSCQDDSPAITEDEMRALAEIALEGGIALSRSSIQPFS